LREAWDAPIVETRKRHVPLGLGRIGGSFQAMLKAIAIHFSVVLNRQDLTK